MRRVVLFVLALLIAVTAGGCALRPRTDRSTEIEQAIAKHYGDRLGSVQIALTRHVDYTDVLWDKRHAYWAYTGSYRLRGIRTPVEVRLRADEVGSLQQQLAGSFDESPYRLSKGEFVDLLAVYSEHSDRPFSSSFNLLAMREDLTDTAGNRKSRISNEYGTFLTRNVWIVFGPSGQGGGLALYQDPSTRRFEFIAPDAVGVFY